MSMSKKDYEAIARIVNTALRREQAIDIKPREVIVMMAEEMAQYCARESMSFDQPRFLKACGVLEDHEAVTGSHVRQTIARITTFRPGRINPERCGNCGARASAHNGDVCP
jgi:hypothetical protein